jgi:hypothetical protein
MVLHCTLLQVWEFDKKLLQADALAPVGQFKYEVATIMRALAMDEFLPAVLAAVPAGGAKGSGVWLCLCKTGSVVTHKLCLL